MAVALHGAFLALDTSVPIPVVALLVPGTSPYRPLWVALGVLGAELMLLIHLSFRFRRRIGVRTWRRLHYATYLVFGAATAHGLMAGSDSARPWALAMYVLASGAVVALTAWRVLGAPRRAPAPPAAQPAEPAPVAGGHGRGGARDLGPQRGEVGGPVHGEGGRDRSGRVPVPGDEAALALLHDGVRARRRVADHLEPPPELVRPEVRATGRPRVPDP